MLHGAPERQWCYKTNKKRQPINICERHVRIHAGFISISVKMGGTSSSIPHRLNNSCWSTSFLHIKKRLHAAWVFVWAVERKTAVCCQGERSEIISIIYGSNVQKRRMRGGDSQYLRNAKRRWNVISQHGCEKKIVVVANMSTFTRELFFEHLLFISYH